VRLHPDARVAEYRARGAWTNETWNDYLDRAVAARPDHVAIVDPPNRAEITDGEAGRWTWRELSEAVDRLAGVFLAAGLGPDDVVGVQLANTRELAQTYLALSRIGAILSPFPVQFRRHELSILGPAVAMKAIVTSGRIKDRANAQVIEEMSADIPSLAMVLAFGDEAFLAVGTGEREHPAVLGDAEVARGLRGAQDHSRGLVDARVRVHHLRVREADHPVVVSDGGDLRRLAHMR